jgi:hypothetical protein
MANPDPDVSFAFLTDTVTVLHWEQDSRASELPPWQAGCGESGNHRSTAQRVAGVPA